MTDLPPVAVPGPASEPICPGCKRPVSECRAEDVDDPVFPGPASVSPAEPPEAASDHLAVTFQCLSCDGDGYNDRWLEDSEGHDFPVSVPCERCGGTGELRGDGEDDPDAR